MVIITGMAALILAGGGVAAYQRNQQADRTTPIQGSFNPEQAADYSAASGPSRPIAPLRNAAPARTITVP